MSFWKQDLKQGKETVKNSLTTKNKRMTQNYLMNSGKFKCQRQNQL